MKTWSAFIALLVVGPGVGLAYSHALPSGVLLRPAVAYGQTRGETLGHIRGGEETTNVYTARLGVGVVLASPGAWRFVPEAGLGYTHVSSDITGAGSSGDRYETREGGASAHVGFTVLRRVTPAVQVGLTGGSTHSISNPLLPFTGDAASFGGSSAGVTVTYDL